MERDEDVKFWWKVEKNSMIRKIITKNFDLEIFMPKIMENLSFWDLENNVGLMLGMSSG